MSARDYDRLQYFKIRHFLLLMAFFHDNRSCNEWMLGIIRFKQEPIDQKHQYHHTFHHLDFTACVAFLLFSFWHFQHCNWFVWFSALYLTLKLILNELRCCHISVMNKNHQEMCFRRERMTHIPGEKISYYLLIQNLQKKISAVEVVALQK